MIIKFSSFLFIVLTITSLNGQTIGKHKLTLLTFPIPMMVESSSKGIFIDLIKEIEHRINVKFVINVYPTKRAYSDFQMKHEYIGIFPAVDIVFSVPFEKSSDICIKKDFIFYLKDSTPFHTIKNLQGHVIGLTRGYPYTKEVTSNNLIKFEFANSDIQNMKKLSKKRIQAFIVEERSGLKALSLSGAKNITYSPAHPISKQDVFFAFKKNKTGKLLSEKFSFALKQMKKDGAFARIMSGK